MPMKHKQKTREELLADLMVKSLNKERTPHDLLLIGRRTKNDRNTIVGNRVALSIVLLELTQSYGWEKEDIVTFVNLFNEFLEVYGHDNDAGNEILEMLEHLKETIGFDVLKGEFPSDTAISEQ